MQFSTFVLAALSMGSAIAGPLAPAQAFTSVASAAANARSVVHNQLLEINLLVGGTPNAESVTKIQKCLVNVGQSVNSISGPAQALDGAGSVPLAGAQLNAVPEFAANLVGIAVDIQAIGKVLTGGRLTKDQQAQIQPELQWALAPAVPIVRPILAYIKIAAPSHTKVFQHISYPLRNIQALLKVVLAIDLDLDLNISIGLGIFI
ncbi:hypothetical protein F4803DRAFT_543065 [Xylaria telfairii]|nr:hypothetical protein F4803DRAFT_543065 [Xylaria telfairii]